MEKYLEVNLIENTEDEKVIAEVKLIKQPDIEYDHAVLYIMGDPCGVFEDDITKFQAQHFGQVECEVIFFKGDASVWEVEQIVDFNISTWFAAAHPDLGHPLTILENGQNREIFSRPRARGNNDICFRLVVRVPVDEELTLYHTIVKETDVRPKHIRALQVHYRGSEYKDRNDLYVPPDEAMYHIDSEKEKWIDGALTLDHGIHVVYVAPSVLHDLSYLVVTGSSKPIEITDGDFVEETSNFTFSVSGFFKTMF